jgi:ABC-type nitrate/sulfonate/bicarbonate transport system substrate-binding protein
VARQTVALAAPTKEHTMRTARFALACLASLIALAAQAQTPLRLVAFDGGWNLPVWAAQRQGFFEANGVTVTLSYTPTSVYLVTALLDAKFDIALALMDNVVAYQEGQGEAHLEGNPDLFAFLGGDGGFASLVAVPTVTRFADLKGKRVAVDAMTTGLAFVARDLLERNAVAETEVTWVRAGGTATRYRDLIAGKEDATVLRTPFELLAGEHGCRELAGTGSLGPYQGTVGVARRSWAAGHEKELIGFLRGYRAGVEWLYDRANRDVVEAMLVASNRDMTPALAKQSYDLLLADQGGIRRDASLDLDGIRTVLRLRSQYGLPRKLLTDPAPYIDLSYYDKAFGKR